MKKLSQNEKAAYSLAAAMLALFLCTAILCVSLMAMLSKTENEYSSYRTNAEIELSDLEKKKNEMNSALIDINNRIELAEKSKSELEMKIGQTEAELKELKNSIGNSDELYKKLNSQLTALKAELKEKESEISSLKSSVQELEKTYGADLNKQYGILVQLYALLNDPPKILVTPAEYGEDGTVITEAVYKAPKISLYYEDLERGHIFKYNEDSKYPASGCLRVPFALSVLMAASDEMDTYNKKLAEYESIHGPTEELPDYTFKYNLAKIFTYTSDKVVDGTGIIKDSEYGSEYTYYELFEAYLKYGDAVAEKALYDEYGTALRKNLLANLGTSVMKSDPSSATASDLAIIMKSVYFFCESGAEYAELLKSSMLHGVHNVLIAPGIVGKDVIHGSGWDNGAYHDMAAVFDDHPYVLVFMSDCEGNDEVNKYVNKLAELIDDVHETFYD